MFLRLRYGRQYLSRPVSASHRLPVDKAAVEAMFWALICPVLWILQEHVFRGRDFWNAYEGADWQSQRLILAGAGALGVATIVSWRCRVVLAFLTTERQPLNQFVSAV